jgi:phage-related tail fiber protein
MPELSAIHTNAGLALLAQAQGEGAQITLAEMAVGDGNGGAITPDAAMTTLAGEIFRAAVNRIYQPDPAGQPTKYAAELVIPAETGAFVLREVGLFTDDGTLFVVGNLPETYKPVPADGAFSDTVIRVEFLVANAGVVNLTVDPSAVTATTRWVIDYVDGQFAIKFATDPQAIAGVSEDTIMSPAKTKLYFDAAIAEHLKPRRARRAYLGGR